MPKGLLKCLGPIALAMLSWGCDDGNKIANMLRLSGDAPALSADQWRVGVSLVRGQQAFGRSPFCSGAFVNDFQVLTAAHCVAFIASEPQTIAFVAANGEDVMAERAHIHPGYRQALDPDDTEQGFTTLPFDVALIDFPRGSSDQWLPIQRTQRTGSRSLQDNLVAIAGSGRRGLEPQCQRLGFSNPLRYEEHCSFRMITNDGSRRLTFNSLATLDQKLLTPANAVQLNGTHLASDPNPQLAAGLFGVGFHGDSGAAIVGFDQIEVNGSAQHHLSLSAPKIVAVTAVNVLQGLSKPVVMSKDACLDAGITDQTTVHCHVVFYAQNYGLRLSSPSIQDFLDNAFEPPPEPLPGIGLQVDFGWWPFIHAKHAIAERVKQHQIAIDRLRQQEDSP